MRPSMSWPATRPISPASCRPSRVGRGPSRPASTRPNTGFRPPTPSWARTIPTDGLTITVSVGASLFDDRYGLSAQAPRHLTAMPAFPDDTPDPAWLHGDLLLQLCADHPDAVHHALRDIAKRTRGGMQLRWKIEGYASPPRPSGTPRNLHGLQGRHGQPDRRRRERPRVGDRPGRAGLGARRFVPGGPADPDARRVLGSHRDHRTAEHLRPDS